MSQLIGESIVIAIFAIIGFFIYGTLGALILGSVGFLTIIILGDR